MRNPKTLLRLTPTKGVARDIPPAEVSDEFYTDALNMDFTDGFARRILDYRNSYGPLEVESTPIAPVKALVNTRLAGINYWILATDDEQIVLDGTNTFDLSASDLSTTVEPYFHQLLLFNGLPVHNNSFDAPMWWNGDTGTDFDELPDWPEGTVARFMTAHRNFLFAMDLTTPAGARHNTVMWSDVGEPGAVPDSWTPGPENLAGSVELADSDSPIITAANLQDSLIIYKRGAVYSASFTEDPDVVFAFRPISHSFGALTRRAVAPMPGGHAVVTDGDVVLFDGVNARSIIHGRLRNLLFDSLDGPHYERLFVTYNRTKQELWILVPVPGVPWASLALIYQPKTDAWSVRELTQGVAAAAVGIVDDGAGSDVWDDQTLTWDQFQRVWDASALTLDRESLVFAQPAEDALLEVDVLNPTTFPAFVRKENLTFGDPARVKFVRRVHVRMSDGSAPVTLRVGSRMSPTDSTIWSDPVTVLGDQIVNVFAQGRYISVEIASNGSGLWGVSGIELEAELRGYF